MPLTPEITRPLNPKHQNPRPHILNDTKPITLWGRVKSSPASDCVDEIGVLPLDPRQFSGQRAGNRSSNANVTAANDLCAQPPAVQFQHEADVSYPAECPGASSHFRGLRPGRNWEPL